MSAIETQSSSRDRVAADPALAELVERLTARLQAGEAVDADAIAANQPEYADRLRQLLPALEVLADLGRSAGHEAAASGPDALAELGVLGDFRIVREVGRGGMGVVYEAEQVSLDRRVALKVLPFAAALDPRRLRGSTTRRRPPPSCTTPHIVPVFAVGCERGVHYYAMQFIEGRTLAEVIATAPARAGAAASGDPTACLARHGARPPPERPAPRGPSGSVADRLGRSSGGRRGWASRRPRRWSTPTAWASSTATSSRPTCCSTPTASSGSPTSAWPGSSEEAGLTLTGDLLGTLRYMSPEQALAGGASWTTAPTSTRWA